MFAWVVVYDDIASFLLANLNKIENSGLNNEFVTIWMKKHNEKFK
jgi:hypothetical protein